MIRALALVLAVVVAASGAKPPKRPPKKMSLQITVGQTPGVEIAPETLAHFREQLEIGLRDTGGDTYVFVAADAKATKTTPKGFGLRGAITERKVEDLGAAGTKISGSGRTAR